MQLKDMENVNIPSNIDRFRSQNEHYIKLIYLFSDVKNFKNNSGKACAKLCKFLLDSNNYIDYVPREYWDENSRSFMDLCSRIHKNYDDDEISFCIGERPQIVFKRKKDVTPEDYFGESYGMYIKNLKWNLKILSDCERKIRFTNTIGSFINALKKYEEDIYGIDYVDKK